MIHNVTLNMNWLPYLLPLLWHWHRAFKTKKIELLQSSFSQPQRISQVITVMQKEC